MKRDLLKYLLFAGVGTSLFFSNPKEISTPPMETCYDLLVQTIPHDWFFCEEFCEEDEEIEAPKVKKVLVKRTKKPRPIAVAKPRHSAEEQRIIKSTAPFFNALAAANVKEAKKYTSNYGLGTLLYFDFADIYSYKVDNCDVMGQTAILDVNFNNMPKSVSCIFHKVGDIWHFQGLDTYKLFSEQGTLHRFGHKVAP